MTTMFEDHYEGKSLKEILKEILADRYTGRDMQVPEGDKCLQFLDSYDNWNPIADSGSMGLITGPKKSRKTFVLSCIVASALKGEPVGPFSLNIPKDHAIIYVDTEQTKTLFKRTNDRILDLAQLDELPDRYLSVPMKRFHNAQRFDALKRLIESSVKKTGNKLGLIVIDGIVDICENFMENTASREVVNQIMHWQDTTGAMIISVLHLNKDKQNTRGFLGTEIDNKCDFSVKVLKRNDEELHSTVYCKDLRAYPPFTPFDVHQDKNSGLLQEDPGSVIGNYDDTWEQTGASNSFFKGDKEIERNPFDWDEEE